MNRIKRLCGRLTSTAALLCRDIRALMPAALPLFALFFLALLLLPRTAAIFVSENRFALVYSRPVRLIDRFLFMPLCAAACSLVLSAVWNRSRIRAAACAQAVCRRFARILLTGLCVALALTALSSLLESLLRLVIILLRWIPLVGAVICRALVCLILLVRAGFSVALPFVLTAAEMPLMSWDLRGQAQAQETVVLLWGGRTDTLPAFVLLILGRILMGILILIIIDPLALYAFESYIYIPECLFDGLCILSAAALCLREHDRQHGWTI